jgi:hypothetical protein
MRRLLMSLIALVLFVCSGSAHAVEIRFYPAKLRPYELDATHGVRSLVIQNMAIINDGKTDATINQVEFEVIERGVPYEVKTLRAAELDRAAAMGCKAAELRHARIAGSSSSAGSVAAQESAALGERAC